MSKSNGRVQKNVLAEIERLNAELEALYESRRAHECDLTEIRARIEHVEANLNDLRREADCFGA